MVTEALDDWIRRSLEGDTDAFAELVKAFHGRVRGHAALLGVASDSIDDVAQEVFIEVYRSLRRYDSSRSMADWIRGITRNVVLRHSERKAREYRIRKDLLSAYLREREESFLDDEHSSSGKESGAIAGLRSCLERLPEHLRTLILLRYAEGKTSDDIAVELKRSAAGVRMALMRTRDALLRCMESRGAEEPA